ncbi:hypothetical protein [Deinococcus roseus]|uniref:PKD domain-containing protein n=1 Tax=Deinococcus roseus TaxID=392414 RepID=A0ABQ2D429_9DEIO|nr:hypothetical protein [Deinococcus roseus]GGJ45385.1 hypothetical protein GCM10008938_34610 [Deinococcus roseus]
MRHLISLTTGLALLLAACGSPTPPPTEPVVAPKVNEKTRVVTEETRKALSTFSFTNAAACKTEPDPVKNPGADPAQCTAKLVFSKSTPYLANLKVGELMVSEPGPGAPYGYLQKITKITPSGGQVIVETQAASLDEALIEGEFDQKGTLGAADLSSLSLKAGVVPRGLEKNAIDPQAQSFNLNINTVLYDQDGNESTTNDQVRLKGNFNLTVDDGLSYSLKWKKVLGVPIYPNGIYVRMAYGFNQSANVRVEAELSTGIEKEIELAKFTFEPITFFIGPVPVVLIPSVRVTSDLKGNISAKMAFGASESVVAQAGFEYNDGFHDITKFEKNFSTFAEVSAIKGTAEVGLNLQGEILLYGLVGPYARVRGLVALDAAVPRDPVWTLNAGLRGYVGIHADLLVKTLDYDKEIFKQDFEIARSANQKPTVNFKSPANGQTYSQNVKIDNICFTMDDLETSNLHLTLSSNLDGQLVSADVSRGNFSSYCLPSRSFSTLGTRTLTATVTDKGGLTATDTRSIEIINNPPSVLIAKPTSGASVYIDTPVLLKGALLDANEELDCTRFTWKSNVGADELPANNCGTPTATFKTLGSHTLTLEARDSQNALGTTSIAVNVVAQPANLPPDVVITEPEQKPGIIPKLPFAGGTMTIKGTITDQDSGNITYTWQFGYLQKSVGPKYAVIEKKTVLLVGKKLDLSLTIKPSDFLPAKTTGEFPCYEVDPSNLTLMLVANDGINSNVVFSVPLERGPGC